MSVKLTAWSKVVFFKEDTVAQVFQKDKSLKRSQEWSMFEEPILPKRPPLTTNSRHKSRWGFFCCIFFSRNAYQYSNPSFRFGKATGIESLRLDEQLFKSFVQHSKVTCFTQPSKTQTGKIIGQTNLWRYPPGQSIPRSPQNASLVRESYPKWPKHSGFRILLWIAQIHTSRKKNNTNNFTPRGWAIEISPVANSIQQITFTAKCWNPAVGAAFFWVSDGLTKKIQPMYHYKVGP